MDRNQNDTPRTSKDALMIREYGQEGVAIEKRKIAGVFGHMKFAMMGKTAT